MTNTKCIGNISCFSEQNDALVAVMVEAFLVTLACQTWLTAVVISQAAGREFYMI